EIDNARISRAASDDELRLVLLGERLHFIEVDAGILGAHAVVNGIEPFAGHVGRRAVREMPASREAHAENGVIGLDQCEEYGLVCLAPQLGWNIAEGAVKQPPRALDSKLLRDFDKLTAAVIAAAWITFSVLVGQNRTLGFEHSARNNVLRSNEFNLALLAL